MTLIASRSFIARSRLETAGVNKPGQLAFGLRNSNLAGGSWPPPALFTKSKDLKPSPDLVLVDGDVSKKETAVKVVETSLKRFGHIDLLVNNAEIFIPKALTDYTDADGVSDLFVQLFGAQAGHVRVVYGVHSAPIGAPLMVETVFEVQPISA